MSMNECNSTARQEAPPFALLLSPPSGGDINNTSTTLDQWLWYFYLTAWPRFFLSDVVSSRAAFTENGKKESTKLSFGELLDSVKFPAASTITAYEARWLQFTSAEEKEEVNARAEYAAKTTNNSAYPPIPRVAESCFGNVLRTLAVHHHLLPLRPTSSFSSLSLEELVLKALAVVHQGASRGEEIGATEGKTEVMQNALRTMFSRDTAAALFPLLLDVGCITTNTTNDDDEKMLKTEAHRARLFAALAVEVFGRVKKVCVGMLLAFLNVCSGKTTAARACGIVMGVVEYAMAYRCHREDGTGRCPLNAAALLLCSLVDRQEDIAREKEEKDVVPGNFVARIIVTCIQNLLFALVTGGAISSHCMSHTLSKDATKQKARGSEQQLRRSLEMFVFPVVVRALTLHEADALLGVLFPTLLQQVGFEWPWSECLRRAQQLEKVQQEGILTNDGVRLNSRVVFNEVLAAISRRTYFARLQNILPQSYDSLLSAIFLKELHNGNGKDEHDGDSGSEQRRLFVLPAYYRAAGEALVGFFERSGLGRTTARETEQILVRNTDVQPMIVQLRALGSRLESTDGTSEQDSHLNDANDLLRTACLSDDEKHRLLLRYRCEILLASLVVYTQLQTVSVVQQLTRRLAPLFEKLLLPLMQERTLRRSFVMTRKSRSADGDDLAGEFAVEFTPEFKVLMDEIHYEFYPLEWVPEVLDEYLQRPIGEPEAALTTSYSVFAAVAYQFGLVLQGNPQGVRGGDGTDYTVRVKAYRFFQILLLNSLADSVMSSCELEGAMAVAATRRVGGSRRNHNNNNNDEGNSAQVLQCGAVSFHAVVNPHDAVFALAQCLLPPEIASRPRVTEETEGSYRMSEGWLRHVVEWARLTKTKWVMQQQTVSTTPFALRYNSLTFDSVPLAREVIRGVRQRLVEKIYVRAAAVNEEWGALPDTLLKQHLVSLQAFLESVGLLQQDSTDSDARLLSAAKLLWSSPLFSNELCLGGRYNAAL